MKNAGTRFTVAIITIIFTIGCEPSSPSSPSSPQQTYGPSSEYETYKPLDQINISTFWNVPTNLEPVEMTITRIVEEGGKIGVLGDSISSIVSGDWPGKMEYLLQAKNPDITVKNYAKIGENACGGEIKLYSILEGSELDLIIITYGYNDWGRLSINQSELCWESMMTTAEAKGVPVIAMTGPFHIWDDNVEVLNFYYLPRKMQDTFPDVGFINLHLETIFLLEGMTEEEAYRETQRLLADKVHWSNAGASEMAGIIFNAINISLY